MFLKNSIVLLIREIITSLFSSNKFLRHASEFSNVSKLICIITGKGDLKQFYLNKIKEMDFKYVQFITPWLTGKIQIIDDKL